MKSKKRQICLFGLSANPPTGKSGHVGIVSYLSEIKSGDDESETRRFDEIRVLPVYKHMYSVSFYFSHPSLTTCMLLCK